MVALRSERLEASISPDDREVLVAELRRIEVRLEDGYRKIDEARMNGRDVGRWEDLWLLLLDDYERIYDQLAA